MKPINRLFIVAPALAALLMVLTIGVVLAQGGQLGGKLLTGSEVTIPAGETVDHDIYVFGGTLTSNGTINGDIVAAGGNIDINGPVKGDVLAAGGRVNITGPVTGDVRAAGGQITISGDVGEDVLAAAGQLTLNGRIGQDLIMSTGQLTLAGTVTGGAIGTAGTLTKSGTIGGTDSITVTGDQGQAFTRAPANPVVDTIRQFLEVLLVAVLALWLAPGLFAGAETAVRQRPLASFGWGIVAFIGYIVAIVMIAIVMSLLAVVLGLLGFGTLVGIDIFAGIILICSLTLAFIIAAAFLVDAVVGLALGRLIAGRSDRVAAAAQRSTAVVPSRWADLGLVVVGVAIVVVLAALPIVGGWVKLVVILLGFGGLWLARGGPRFFTTRTEVPPWSTRPPAATPPASPPPAAPAS
jgi:hypothetical protein